MSFSDKLAHSCYLIEHYFLGQYRQTRQAARYSTRLGINFGIRPTMKPDIHSFRFLVRLLSNAAEGTYHPSPPVPRFWSRQSRLRSCPAADHVAGQTGAA